MSVQHTVDKLKVRMRLADWTITVLDEPCDDESSASVSPTYGRKVATIRLAADFGDQDAADQRHSLIHELIHLHLVGATDIIRCDTSKHLGQGEYDILWCGFRRQIEYAVDGLADVIAGWEKP